MALQFLLGEINGGYWIVPYEDLQTIYIDTGSFTLPATNMDYDILDVEEIEGWSGE